MMGKLIQWDEIYCFQKFLPLLTRWQLHHICDGTENVTLRGSVQPDFIKKKRTPKGVPSYEIVWKDEQGCFDCLIPDAQLQIFYSTHKEKPETEALQLLWSTIEPMDLVEKAYPKIVEKFDESKSKGKKSKKTTKTQSILKPTKNCKAKSANVDATKKPVQKLGTKSKTKNQSCENVRPISLFFRKEKAKWTAYTSPKIKTSTKPMNLSAFSMEFNDSFTQIDNDDMNLSTIINEMVSRPPDVTEFRGKKLRFDEITSKQNDSLNLSGDFGNAIENYQNNIEKVVDESVDDFDLIVMRKGRKSFIDQKKSVFARDSFDEKLNNCSTPVLPKQNAALNSIEMHSFVTDSPFEIKYINNRKNSMISSSFFAVNPDDEIDLFEKSIDFRNMQGDSSSEDESDETDETQGTEKAEEIENVNGTDPNTESGESEINELSHTSLNDYDDDDEIDKYDTFDRLVGLGKQ